MSSLSTNLQSIEVLKERNMAADLEERNMAADFGYPNLQSIEVLKERAKAAKFGFVSYENLPSSSFQAGSSLIESLRSSQASCHNHDMINFGREIGQTGHHALLPVHLPVSSFNAVPAFESFANAENIDHMTADGKHKFDDTASKEERRKAHRKLHDASKNEREAARKRKHYIENREREVARQSKYQASHRCLHGKRKNHCAACKRGAPT